MLPCFLATFHQHLQKLARFFPFFIEADYGPYGIASTLEPALRDPSIYFLERFIRQPKLNLGQPITVNNTVYRILKPFHQEPLHTSQRQTVSKEKVNLQVCPESIGLCLKAGDQDLNPNQSGDVTRKTPPFSRTIFISIESSRV